MGTKTFYPEFFSDLILFYLEKRRTVACNMLAKLVDF